MKLSDQNIKENFNNWGNLNFYEIGVTIEIYLIVPEERSVL